MKQEIKQIRVRLNLKPTTLEQIETNAAAKGQGINRYLSDLIEGRIYEKDCKKRENEKMYEVHVFMPE